MQLCISLCSIKPQKSLLALCTLSALTWMQPCVCCVELQDMHQTAQSDAKESREELDSLSNLIGRLDFNDFFKPKPDYRAMLAHSAI